MKHYVKIEPRWLQRIRSGEKTAEVRLDDRDYQAGDTLFLYIENRKWDCHEAVITHVLRGVGGLHAGYVVLSLQCPHEDELQSLRRENERLTRSNRSLRAAYKRIREGAAL